MLLALVQLGMEQRGKAGPISQLPDVQLLRLVGRLPSLWAEVQKLPGDFGGWVEGREMPHGMAGLDAMALARTNLEVQL